MNTKALIESKAFWLAVAQLVLAGIAIFQTQYPELQSVGALGVIKSLIDIFLRANTTQPIGGILKR